MITYDLTNTKKSLYEEVYCRIKADIQTGKLKPGDRLPSKRALSQNMGISISTVENAYGLLTDEGFIASRPKSGYFVLAQAETIKKKDLKAVCAKPRREDEPDAAYSLSAARGGNSHFPTSIWSRLMREVLSMDRSLILGKAPCSGAMDLRRAIAGHLWSFRGISADEDCIFIGAGTEYLYGILIKLLGMDRVCCLENPGYARLRRIYGVSGAKCRYAGMDEGGIRVEEIGDEADLVHVSPSHHFPTGVTMTAKRRGELLSWAEKAPGRYIIEDDYDSEFCVGRRPLPTLFSMDRGGRVIYMNTFSKSLASNIRVSYMVLPPELAALYYEKLSFYSCPVSVFEQYTLAAFIERGYFEKHINRMRRLCAKTREEISQMLSEIFLPGECTVPDKTPGLHMVLKLATEKSDAQIVEALFKKGIRVRAVSEYYAEKRDDTHSFLLDYSDLKTDSMAQALKELREAAFG